MTEKNRIEKVGNFFATGFGLGNLPIAPGTWGTLGGVVLYVALLPFSLFTYITVIIIAFVLGCWLCEKVSLEMQKPDPACIVWDEIVGYGVAMIGVSKGMAWMCAGFVLFRLFDMIKPWPISWVDKKVKGGIGIMLDDLLAGLFTWIILQGYHIL